MRLTSPSFSLKLFSGIALAAFLGGVSISPNTASAQEAPHLTKVKAATAERKTVQLTAYITGYSYWDNTPPGSAEIARPVVHRLAGGKGSYSDPITLAVGHSIANGRQTLDVPAGTRIYLKRLRKYAIVEDVCGDGPRPQTGPCHTGHRGHPWFDIYVGGAGSTAGRAQACMNRITALQTVIIHPRKDLPVVAGALTESGCRVF